MSINKLQIYNKEYNIATPEEIEEVKEGVSDAVSTANVAKQESVKALELAQGVEEKVGNIKSESFTLTNVNGWKRALEFTGNGLALIFSLSAVDAIASVSGVINAALNTSCLISQLSSRDVDRLHLIDKAAILFRGDRTILFIHTPKNIASIKLVINGTYQEAVYQNVDESLPDGAYIYDFKVDSGIIADRAIADENGDNIPETYMAKRTAQFTMKNIGYCHIFDVKKRCFSTILLITKSEGASIGMAAAFSIEAACSADGIQRVYINQIGSAGNDSAIDQLCLKYEVSTFKWSVYLHYNGVDTLEFDVHNITGQDFNFVLSDVGSLPEGSYYYPIERANIGIIADKAMSVNPSVFVKHEVIKRYNVSTNDELEAAINDSLTNAPDYGDFEFLISVKVSSLILHGGTWYFKGFKGDANYGYIEGRIYRVDGGKVRRVKSSGQWSNWIQDSFSCHAVTDYAYTSNIEEINTWLDNIYIKCSDHSYFEGAIGISTSSFEIPGGLYYVTGYRWTLNDGGYQEAKSYITDSVGGIRYFSRSRHNGNWTQWKNMIPS